MADCVNVLEGWTDMASAMVIFDSTVDEFTHDGLFEMVKGKKNVALVATTTDGDVFGGFYSVAVTGQDEFFDDQAIFAFSFESHGRCMTPQRFVVKERLKNMTSVRFEKNIFNGFVLFWVGGVGGGFYLGNEVSRSFCCEMSLAFEGLQNTTLSGKSGTCFEGPFHHCTRLIAIQLE